MSANDTVRGHVYCLAIDAPHAAYFAASPPVHSKILGKILLGKDAQLCLSEHRAAQELCWLLAHVPHPPNQHALS
jgi:hypothetical protein